MTKKVSHAQFSIGSVVQHKLFGYYGVIYDIDPVFLNTDEWYEAMAKSRPPKDQPWYHVIVNKQPINTYVAERNLVESKEFVEIEHPLIEQYFCGHDKKKYLPRSRFV